MNSLVNESVEHIKFGKGVIISEGNFCVDIVFENVVDKKSFLFPDSFEKFMKLKNETLQKECFELAVKKKEAIENEIQEKRRELDRVEQERVELEKKSKLESSKRKRTKVIKKTVQP